jgi:hypothetical protein
MVPFLFGLGEMIDLILLGGDIVTSAELFVLFSITPIGNQI